MIIENESDTSPDNLAKLRAEALRRQKNGANEESSWRSSFDQTEHPNVDGSLQMSRFLAIAALVIIAIAVVYPAAFSILFAGWGILLLYTLHMIVQDKQKRAVIDNSIIGNHLPLPKATSLWSVAIPLAMIASLYVILPMNAVTEGSISRWMFLSVLASACCVIVSFALNTKIKQPKLLGFLNGITFGTALSALVLFTSLMALSSHAIDFAILVPVIGLLLFYSSGLLKKLLLSVDRKVSMPVFFTACIGALASFAFGIAPELRGLAVSLGEKLAVSADATSADFGYRILQDLDATPELEIASDANQGRRPLSVAASFLPIGYADAEKMYFFVSGKAHSVADKTIDNFQNVKKANPDEKVVGLTLADSKISGHVDANALTSVTYWTMVFGNNSGAPQEAQAKIALPPNAAISRVTLWVNGKPQEAAFNSTWRVEQAYQWITERHRDPLLITETANGIVNLQAYPVPKFGEMKVRIGITSGLDAKSKRDFSFVAPRILSSNFGLDDAKTFVKLESNAPISSNAEDGNQITRSGKLIYTGQILPGGVRNYQFVAHRATDFAGYSARATHSKEDMIISEKLVKSSDDVSKLAIVIDGSKAVKASRDEIKRALASIPKGTNAKVFIADHRDDVEALSTAEAINRLDALDYSGGVDDTKSLIAARKHVGRNSHAAIVWIHGPQPIVFPQDKSLLRQLMMSGEHRLKIYDFQLDADQGNQVRSYLAKLDQSASPDFRTIEQGGSVEQDLTNFFKSSSANSAEYAVVREKVTNKHLPSTSYDFPIASRLSTVWAANEARRCAELGQMDTAVLLGTAYRVVTPATGAVVMELQSDYEYQNLHRNFYSVVSAKAHASAETGDGSADPNFILAWGNEDKSQQPMPSAAPSPVRSRRAVNSEASRESRMVPPPPPTVPVAEAAKADFSNPYASDASSSGASNKAASTSIGVVNSDAFAASDDARSAESQVLPSLQGATNGSIGPQGNDATVITGVNTAGTVRVNNVANLEMFINLVVLGLQGLSIVYAGLCLVQGFFLPNTRSTATRKLLLGSALLLIAFCIPELVNYLIIPNRNANLFS
ncbi:MAG: hypothetical protein JST89_03630 [Cyanobacteria bacterium SZAS-4]|nr:hypothetical protein [Cyanobacteria bacterium SZAS-4]